MDKDVREALKESRWLLEQSGNISEFDDQEHCEECFRVSAVIEAILNDESKD